MLQQLYIVWSRRVWLNILLISLIFIYWVSFALFLGLIPVTSLKPHPFSVLFFKDWGSVSMLPGWGSSIVCLDFWELEAWNFTVLLFALSQTPSHSGLMCPYCLSTSLVSWSDTLHFLHPHPKLASCSGYISFPILAPIRLPCSARKNSSA